MTTLIIDGDPVAYLAVFAANAAAGDPGRLALNNIERHKRQFGADRVIVALSDPSRVYWRHELDPQYKAGRAAPPEGIDVARAGMVGRNIIQRQLPGFEADDLIGILATDPRVEGRKIIVATDEHMLTIPGEHHRPKKSPPGKTVKISRTEAECRHLQQTLRRIKGVGPKTAEEVVTPLEYAASPAACWTKVVDTFAEYDMDADEALKQARIARVCRVTEFDQATRSVIPWMPPDEEYTVHRVEDAPAVAAASPAPAKSLFAGDGPRQKWT